MSLQPQIYTVPAETACIAKTIFPDGNLYMNWYDSSAMLFKDKESAHLYP